MIARQMPRKHGRAAAGTVLAAVTAAVTLAGGGAPALAAHQAARPGGPAEPGGAAPSGTISTLAGGVGGPGPGPGISLSDANSPGGCGLNTVTFAAGSLYIADGAVRQVSAQTGLLTTPAGTGAAGPLRLGGPAASAPLGACGVAVDKAGNLVIGDMLRHRIDVVPARTGTFYGQAMTAGHLYPIAGNGTAAAGGSGVPALKTAVSRPIDVALDGAGNIVIADEGTTQPSQRGSRVRVVAESTGTFYGQQMTAGDIYTVAGSVTGLGDSPDGGPATQAAIGEFLLGVRVDAAGNLVLATSDNGRVRVVAARTGTFYGQQMTAGDIYGVAGGGSGGTANGIPATQATLNGPGGVALDAAGNLLISDTFDNLIRVAAASTGTFYGQQMTAGDIYTIAGGGPGPRLGDRGPATSAVLAYPEGLTVDAAGNVVIADFDHDRVRVVAAGTGTFYGQPMTAGDIYTVAGISFADFCCDGAPATTAQMNAPASVVSDPAGDLVIADETDQRIRFVAATSGTFFGQHMTAGDIYTVAGDGKKGFVPNGIPATQAALHNPVSVAADQSGNLLIADSQNAAIEVVAARTGTFYGQPMTVGDIYTVAGDGSQKFSGDGGPATSAGIGIAQGVALDHAGNVLIADGTSRIRVVAVTTGTFYGQQMTAGDIYTVAGGGNSAYSGDGGPATGAGVGPASVAADGTGNLVIADGYNSRIRVVAESTGTFYGQPMTVGDIYTVAGNGTFGFAGDGGPATGAEFYRPSGVAVDSAGNIVVADTHFDFDPTQMGNNRVRVIAARTGTFYGVPMTAGDIYTVAGDGGFGFSGDGGPAARAELADPTGVGFDAAGDLLVADAWDGRVREVAR